MRDRQSAQLLASHGLTAALVLFGAVFLAVAAAMGDSFYLRLATEALIFAGLALSVDLLLGCTGALSLGQALYFGAGAYASALVLVAGGSFATALAAGLGGSVALAIVGGVIANRVRGVYFALITIALAQIGAKVVYNTPALGASDGLIGVPVVAIGSLTSTGSPAGFFVVVGVIVLAMYAMVAAWLGTPFGRGMLALKANESRLAFLGYSVWRARMAGYVAAGGIAGLSGALYPMLRGFASPELLSFGVSGNALIAVVVGGAGTLVGALFGSLLLVVLRSVLSTWTTHFLIIIGALFIVSMLFLPQGLMGWLRPRIAARLGGGDAP